MKKLFYAILTLVFLVVTISMISKNHPNTTMKKQANTELTVRNDIVTEQRP